VRVPRLGDDKRAAIFTDIGAGQLSLNAIARKHRVAGSTVSAIADEDEPEADPGE
jgi:hypothetical protein